jgi:hypothetical protein
MRISPVQLLASSIERIRIDPVNQEVADQFSDADLFRSLLVYRHCEKGPDYWPTEDSVDDGLRDRTYRIRLGLKTHFEDGRSIFPYQFEIVVSGYFAVVEPKPIGDLSPQDAAVQYGFTMLLGAIRETLLTSTARMPNKQFLLPTFTFLGEKFADLATSAAQAKLPLEG